MVAGEGDNLDELKNEVMSGVSSAVGDLMRGKASGVQVQASTLGALEALVQFLQKEADPPVAVGGCALGPVHRRDILRAEIAVQGTNKLSPEYSTILAFDVEVDSDAREDCLSRDVRGEKGCGARLTRPRWIIGTHPSTRPR